MKNRKKLSQGHLLNQNPLFLLRASLHSICQNPVIVFPTIVLAFIQFFTLEILYFAPQYPLSYFFAPLIKAVWGEEYLHYPLNFVLLPKIFYYAQMIIYLFFGSFLLALSSKIVSVLNDHPRVNVRIASRETLKSYIHIFFASLISFMLFQLFASGYLWFLQFLIEANPFGKSSIYWSKALLWTVPYMQFLAGILATTVVVYIIPIVVVSKEKIFKALFKNLKILFFAFPTSLGIVGLPTLLYLPILVMRNNIPGLVNTFGPEIQLFVIIAGLVVSMAIDLIIITTITTFYLFIKENS